MFAFMNIVLGANSVSEFLVVEFLSYPLRLVRHFFYYISYLSVNLYLGSYLYDVV